MCGWVASMRLRRFEPERSEDITRIGCMRAGCSGAVYPRVGRTRARSCAAAEALPVDAELARARAQRVRVDAEQARRPGVAFAPAARRAQGLLDAPAHGPVEALVRGGRHGG